MDGLPCSEDGELRAPPRLKSLLSPFLESLAKELN